MIASSQHPNCLWALAEQLAQRAPPAVPGDPDALARVDSRARRLTSSFLNGSTTSVPAGPHGHAAERLQFLVGADQRHAHVGHLLLCHRLEQLRVSQSCTSLTEIFDLLLSSTSSTGLPSMAVEEHFPEGREGAFHIRFVVVLGVGKSSVGGGVGNSPARAADLAVTSDRTGVVEEVDAARSERPDSTLQICSRISNSVRSQPARSSPLTCALKST